MILFVHLCIWMQHITSGWYCVKLSCKDEGQRLSCRATVLTCMLYLGFCGLCFYKITSRCSLQCKSGDWVYICVFPIFVCVFVYTQVTSERLWDGVQLWSLVWGEGGGWGGEAQPPSASVTSSSSQALWAHAFHTIFFRFNHELCVSLAVRSKLSSQSLGKTSLELVTSTPDQWPVIL